jgi:hypothetical protein
MKIRIVMGYIAIGIVVQFLTPGCATSHIRRESANMPRYQPEQYPLTVVGTEFGAFTSGGVAYRHFHFGHFPWPARYGQTMHIFVPDEPLGEPIFMNSPADLWAFEYRNRADIPAQYIYRGGRLVSLQVPKATLAQPDKTAILIVTASQKQVPTQGQLAQTIVHLNATKSGPGSEVSIGAVGPNGEITWGKPRILQDVPYQWQWFSPLYHGYYVLTVPFDVLTFPIQLPVYGFYYMMGRGMSPR